MQNITEFLSVLDAVWPYVSSGGFLIVGLAYFKYIKSPREALEVQVNNLNSDLIDLRGQLYKMADVLDQINQSRIKDAILDGETRDRLEEARKDLKVSQTELSNLRVTVAELRKE